MAKLLVLALITVISFVVSYANLCERIAQGSCYQPTEDRRICLNHASSSFCQKSSGQKCCVKFSNRLVEEDDNEEEEEESEEEEEDNDDSEEGEVEEDQFLCESVHHGTCISMLMPSPRKCVKFAEESTDLCRGSQKCCTQFDEGGTEENPNNEECGSPSFPIADDWRIIRGRQAERGSWPWQVALQFNTDYTQHLCGGSIIDRRWILTAAHCLNGRSPQDLKVAVGQHSTYDEEDTRKLHQIDEIFIHPYFDVYSKSSPNDIGLIRLTEPIEYNDQTKPVCLPYGKPEGHYDAHPECWITGWGDTRGTGDQNYLQQLKGYAWKNEECARYWRTILKPSMICIGNPSQGSCNGDSGGPMVCRDNGKFYQVGVTTFGTIYCQFTPSVYTRVTSFLDWIQQVKQSRGE